ncbi:hypothetical protein BDW72DRAFT_198078 [Aspergillus terricola var. indicus]
MLCTGTGDAGVYILQVGGPVKNSLHSHTAPFSIHSCQAGTPLNHGNIISVATITNATSSLNVKPTTAEFTHVLHAARHYVEALRTGDIELSRKGFHKHATMYGSFGPEFSAGPIQNLFDMMREKGATPQLDYHLTVLSSTHTTAIVQVDSEQETEGFRDYVALVKVEGRW